MKRSLTRSAGGILCAAVAEKWPGVDESVVERYANQAGHPAGTPLIDIQGDLLLFAFLVAGLIGGFVIGYYWRALFKERSQEPENRSQESGARIQENCE